MAWDACGKTKLIGEFHEALACCSPSRSRRNRSSRLGLLGAVSLQSWPNGNSVPEKLIIVHCATVGADEVMAAIFEEAGLLAASRTDARQHVELCPTSVGREVQGVKYSEYMKTSSHNA